MVFSYLLDVRIGGRMYDMQFALCYALLVYVRYRIGS